MDRSSYKGMQTASRNKEPEHSPEGRGYRNLNSSHNLLSLDVDSNLRSTSFRIVPQLTLLLSQSRGRDPTDSHWTHSYLLNHEIRNKWVWGLKVSVSNTALV